MRPPTAKTEGNRMHGKQTILPALIVAAAALLTSIGVASPAQAATSATATIAAPAQIRAWYIKRVYAYLPSCKAAGQAYVDTDYAKAYKCEWDSPGVALWLNSY